MTATRGIGRSIPDFMGIDFDLNRFSPRHFHPSFFGLEFSVTRPDPKWVEAHVEEPFNFRFEHFYCSSDQPKSISIRVFKLIL